MQVCGGMIVAPHGLANWPYTSHYVPTESKKMVQYLCVLVAVL